jgi:hypothetical protein
MKKVKTTACHDIKDRYGHVEAASAKYEAKIQHFLAETPVTSANAYVMGLNGNPYVSRFR